VVVLQAPRVGGHRRGPALPRERAQKFQHGFVQVMAFHLRRSDPPDFRHITNFVAKKRGVPPKIAAKPPKGFSSDGPRGEPVLTLHRQQPHGGRAERIECVGDQFVAPGSATLRAGKDFQRE